MKVKFKKLHPAAVTPSYAKLGDAGLDITAVNLQDWHDQVTYMTGIAVEIPEGYVGLLFPRSSVRKYHLSLSNSVGVLDSGYRGEIQFTFNKNNGPASYKYKIGDRIGQLVIIPYPTIELEEVDQLSESERGEGGFGSSGI
jgi:dUTP pyrophosphatase